MGALFILAQSAAVQAQALQRFSYTEYHMGVDARIIVYAPDKAKAETACSAAFERMAALDTMMSDYRPSSELMQLCDKAGGPPVHVSPELFLVLERSEEIAKLSGGSFDVTIGPAVALWRIARKTGVLPDPAELEKARRLIGWRKMSLDRRLHTVRLLLPGMKLDLGGIAKGYADDEAQRVLKKNGISRALVQMGGDIVVSGPPPGTKGWTIRIPNAQTDLGKSKRALDLQVRERQPHAPPQVQLFANCAISTSGDTEQFVVIGGKRYSHVIDPLTSQAMTNRVQATVIARDGLTSDPLTKGVILLGKRQRARLLRAFPHSRCYVRVIPTLRG